VLHRRLSYCPRVYEKEEQSIFSVLPRAIKPKQRRPDVCVRDRARDGAAEGEGEGEGDRLSSSFSCASDSRFRREEPFAPLALRLRLRLRLTPAPHDRPLLQPRGTPCPIPHPSAHSRSPSEGHQMTSLDALSLPPPSQPLLLLLPGS
jgi:hypothetical protein